MNYYFNNLIHSETRYYVLLKDGTDHKNQTPYSRHYEVISSFEEAKKISKKFKNSYIILEEYEKHKHYEYINHSYCYYICGLHEGRGNSVTINGWNLYLKDVEIGEFVDREFPHIEITAPNQEKLILRNSRFIHKKEQNLIPLFGTIYGIAAAIKIFDICTQSKNLAEYYQKQREKDARDKYYFISCYIEDAISKDIEKTETVLSKILDEIIDIAYKS